MRTGIRAGARSGTLGAVCGGVSSPLFRTGSVGRGSPSCNSRMLRREPFTGPSSGLETVGRSTAPVGREPTSPVAPPVGVTSGRGSRPFHTRDRRSSRSNGAPGLRSPAPVGVPGISVPGTRSRRATVQGTGRSPFGDLRNSRSGRTGTSPVGSASTTRRPQRSSRVCGRGFGPPKSRRSTPVTPRQSRW